jgi:hypothetical protein
MLSAKEMNSRIDQIMANVDDYDLKGSDLKFLTLLREAQARSGSRKLTRRQKVQIQQILETVMPESMAGEVQK